MNITREVHFTREEVEEMTREAMRVAATRILGEPGCGEVWDIDPDSYNRRAAIVEKKETPAEEIF